MKYTTNHDTAGSGGWLQGHIEADYSLLHKLFGEPSDGDGYKTDAEWSVEFEDGTCARIYNYKTGKNYMGEEGIPVEMITRWHIGSKHSDASSLVFLAIQEGKSK